MALGEPQSWHEQLLRNAQLERRWNQNLDFQATKKRLLDRYVDQATNAVSIDNYLPADLPKSWGLIFTSPGLPFDLLLYMRGAEDRFTVAEF